MLKCLQSGFTFFANCSKVLQVALKEMRNVADLCAVPRANDIGEILPYMSRAPPVRQGEEGVTRGRVMDRPTDVGKLRVAMSGVAFRKALLAPLLLVLLVPACAELELLTGGARGGAGPPPSGSLSVSFIDVG